MTETPKEPVNLWELSIYKRSDETGSWLEFFLEADGDEIAQGEAGDLDSIVRLSLNAIDRSGLEEVK